MPVIGTILRYWRGVESALIGALIFAALAVFLGGGLLRILAPLHAIDWADEVALYCIVWATMLAGGALVAEKRHISTEIFVSLLPAPVARAVGWAMTALTLAFCVAMTVYGWQAYEFAILLDERSGSTLRTQKAYALFLALPLGMALIVLRIGLMLVQGERPFADTGAPQKAE